jgi:hypothetical protein
LSARAAVVSGGVAKIQFTVWLNPDTAPSAAPPLARWGRAEYYKIECEALAKTACKVEGRSSSPDTRLDSPEDAVISVALVKTPERDVVGHCSPASTRGRADHPFRRGFGGLADNLVAVHNQQLGGSARSS